MRVDCDIKSCNEYIEIPDDEIDEAGGIKTALGYKAMLEFLQENGWDTFMVHDQDHGIFFYCPRDKVVR